MGHKVSKVLSIITAGVLLPALFISTPIIISAAKAQNHSDSTNNPQATKEDLDAVLASVSDVGIFFAKPTAENVEGKLRQLVANFGIGECDYTIDDAAIVSPFQGNILVKAKPSSLLYEGQKTIT
jgi:hypothetical protein